jgi:hypothetical protein
VAVGRLLVQQSRIKAMRVAYFFAVQRLVHNTAIWSDVYDGDVAAMLRQEGLCTPATYEAFVAVCDAYGRPMVDAIGINGCSRVVKLASDVRDQVCRTALRRAASLGRCLGQAELNAVVLDVLAANQGGPRRRSRPGPVTINPSETANVNRENSKLLREISKLRQEAMETGRAGAVEAVLYTHLPALVNLLRTASNSSRPSRPSASPPS